MIIPLVLAFGLVFPQQALSKDASVSSAWADVPVQINGNRADWTGAVLGTERGIDVDYSFMNDAVYVYILFVFKDPESLSSINQSGITLYFNKEGKRGKDHGILFKMKTVKAEELIALLEKHGQALSEERKQQLRTKPNYVLFDSDLLDKKGNVLAESVGSMPDNPPSFRTGKDGEAVVYEFRVPIIAVQGQPAGIGTWPGQALKVGFEWGGITPEMKAAMASQGGFSGEGGAPEESSFELITEEGGGRGVGAGGPGLSSRMAQMRRKMKKHSFWVDVTLAKKE